MIRDILEFLIPHWRALYERAPKTTAAGTILLVLAIFAVGFSVDLHDGKSSKARRLQNQDYTKQIDSLGATRTGLENLIQFVDDQKKQLEQSEDALSSLRSQHAQLKPLVEADRKVIDALFAAQEGRNQAAQSKERWIGFGLGVVASFIASIVFGIVMYFVRPARRIQ